MPLLTLGLEIVGAQVMSAVNTVERNDPVGLIVLAMVAAYSAGAHTRGRTFLASALVVLAAMILAMIEDGSSVNVSGFLFFAFFFGAPFLAGVVIRIRRERERLLVSQRDEKARVAVAEQRARIARELHDVVAHTISVIALQARGARHAEGDDRDEASEATGAKVLAEMRRLLHILRADDEDVALAHALKHAGPARARVSVRFQPDALELEIADTGTGSSNGVGGGHGLAGMRERVAVFGGELASGPRPEGGFTISARLPL